MNRRILFGLAFSIAWVAAAFLLELWTDIATKLDLVHFFLLGIGVVAYCFSLLPALALLGLSTGILVGLHPNGPPALGFGSLHTAVSLLLYAAAGTVMAVGGSRLGTRLRDLRETEHTYRSLVEWASEGVLLFDKYLSILDVNPQACEMIGLRREELIGRNFLDLIPEHRIESFPAELEQMIEGKRFLWECPLRRGDGVVFTLEASARMLRGGRVLAIIRDVTDKRRIEKELHDSEARFRQLSEASFEGIIIHRNGEILDINQAAAAMLGIQPSEAVGLSALQFVAPESMALAREHVSQDEADTYEIVALHSNGSRFPAEVKSRTMDFKGGRVKVVALRDLSERKWLEQQLRSAQKMEALGRLAGGIAHDFNNLLTIIQGHGDMLLTGMAPDDPGRESLQEILRAADRAAALSRQLLIFGRRQAVRPQHVDLNAIVTGLEPMLRRLIGEDVQMRISLGAGLPKISADPGQIEQVIMNLCLNARDAMPEGGRLTITTAEVRPSREEAQALMITPHRSYIALIVSDTGTGMDSETCSRIFEPFFTTKSEGKGTGLGLATVFAIVKQHGGGIAVRSEPSCGATFTAYLNAAGSAQIAVPEASREPAAAGNGETILLVEDEEGVRRLMRDALLSMGYTVIEAGSGQEALAIAQTRIEDIHLLITDVVMLGMSGPQLAGQVRELRPGLRVLFVSGYTDDALTRHGIAESTINFLAKPFFPTALASKVREVLDAPGHRGGSSAN